MLPLRPMDRGSPLLLVLFFYSTLEYSCSQRAHHALSLTSRSLSDDKEWQAYLAAEYAEELKKREASAVWKPSAQMRSSTTVIKVTDMKVLTTHHNTLHPPHAHSQPHPCVTVIIDSPSRDVNRLNLSLTSDLKAILQVVSQRRHPQPLHKAL